MAESHQITPFCVILKQTEVCLLISVTFYYVSLLCILLLLLLSCFSHVRLCTTL